MGLRDKLSGAGRILAGAAGQALIGFSEDTNLKKASDKAVPTEEATEQGKSLLWDPFAIIEQLGFREKPSGINYGTLKAMVWKTQILQAIINTRVNQVASFAQPSHDRHALGFRLKLRDSEKEPTKQDKIWIRDYENIIMSNGVLDDSRVSDSLETYLRKITRDSLIYDQDCTEIIPNRKGQPAAWYAVDGSTFRLANTASTYNKNDPDQTIRYVQIYDGIIIAEYTAEELCFGIRNPNTDIRLYGYGMSEVEMLIQTVTALLWSWEYNQKAFSNASAIPGILNFKGSISDRMLAGFRRHWYQSLSGVSNSFKTPITNANEIQWIPLKENNRDMEYSAWFDFLIKIACSTYQMDPVEVNFKYGNGGQRSSMNEANNKEKITESKERGLRPILRHISGNYNTHIIWPTNPDFEFAFVGLDSKTRDDVADINTKLVKSTRMVDELRAEDDLEPLPDGKGQVILDPSWMQFAQQIDGARQEQEGDGEEPDFAGLLGNDDDDDDSDNDDKKDNDKKEKKPEDKTEKSFGGQNGRRYPKYIVDLEI